jgi:glycosyltransferase involved in cell wall biosynthesis
MILRDLKLLWLCDYTIKEVPAGGAEITDDHIIRAGRSLGYDISVIRPSGLRSNCVESSDVIIFSNCYEFMSPARKSLIETKPYIVFTHDSGRWMSVVKEHPSMLKNSLANIFLSPLHRDCFKAYLPEQTNQNLLVPPHIPVDFYDMGRERVNRVMFAGNIHSGKGVQDIIEFAKVHPNIHIDFFYNRSQSNLVAQLKQLKNCHLKGYRPKEEIFECYNKYKYFMHIPQHQEAFGRAVGEAFLCGCDLIVNDRVGAMSYGWDYSVFREKTLYSQFTFWHDLERICIDKSI